MDALQSTCDARAVIPPTGFFPAAVRKADLLLWSAVLRGPLCGIFTRNRRWFPPTLRKPDLSNAVQQDAHFESRHFDEVGDLQTVWQNI